MSASVASPLLPAREIFDTVPAVNVAEAEYSRLLGYPPHHAPGERADELAAWARRWFAEHGRPWVYLREAELELADGGALRLDGAEFQSRPLHDHLRSLGARRSMLMAVSAGPEAENEARQRWEEAKPDEYFFLEMFGSAVVENLVAATNGRVCDLAEREGLMAVPHYSPGYAGWDVAEQNKLFALITGGATHPLPGPLEVLSSGMLRPKKSLIAVIGLAPAIARAHGTAPAVPCEGCSFSPCQYRRRPYRHAARVGAATEPTAGQPESQTRETQTAALPSPAYTVSARALKKWAGERVRLAPRADGGVVACFRFDGTTCSNSGQPLAFDYTVTLGPPEQGRPILRADCRPAPDDEGHRRMCAYLTDADGLMRAIAEERPPLVGRPLDEIFAWARVSSPSGCHCASAGRAHKWGLALEAIHYTLAHSGASAAASSFSSPS